MSGKALASVIGEALEVDPGGVVAYADLRQSPPDDAAAVRRRLAERKIPVIGSNCMGALSVRRGVALYSGDVNSHLLAEGSVGFVSQSGSILIGMISAAPRARYSHLFSVGNEDTVSAADYIEFLARDEATQSSAAFLRQFGIPRDFGRATRLAAENGKPVIALTVGKSRSARENAATHSGALAPDSAVMSAFLSACGVLEVASVEALIETVIAFQCDRIPAGRSVGMVHVSGGQASLQLDTGSHQGFSFPKLGPVTLRQLEQAAPSLQSPQNPIDAWGPPSYRDNYPPALDALAADPEIDIVVSNQDIAQFVCDAGPHVTRSIADAVIASSRLHPKPIFMISNVSLGCDDKIVADLHEAGVPLLLGAVAGYEALALWARFHLRRTTGESPADFARREPVLDGVAGPLDEMRSLAFLSGHGLRTPRMIEAADDDAVATAAEMIGYPLSVEGRWTDVATQDRSRSCRRRHSKRRRTTKRVGKNPRQRPAWFDQLVPGRRIGRTASRNDARRPPGPATRRRVASRSWRRDGGDHRRRPSDDVAGYPGGRRGDDRRPAKSQMARSVASPRAGGCRNLSWRQFCHSIGLLWPSATDWNP